MSYKCYDGDNLSHSLSEELMRTGERGAPPAHTDTAAVPA